MGYGFYKNRGRRRAKIEVDRGKEGKRHGEPYFGNENPVNPPRRSTINLRIDEDPAVYYGSMFDYVNSMPKRDFFIDQDHVSLCTSYMSKGLFTLFLYSIDSMFVHGRGGDYKFIKKLMDRAAEGFCVVSDLPNVYITREVLSGTKEFLQILAGKLDRFSLIGEVRDSILDPIRVFYEAQNKANYRLGDAEEDPFIDRILQALGVEREIEADMKNKRMLAAAIATASLDGREKTLLSYNRSLRDQAGDLSRRLLRGGTVIRCEDLFDISKLERVDLTLARLLYDPIDGRVRIDERKFYNILGTY